MRAEQPNVFVPLRPTGKAPRDLLVVPAFAEALNNLAHMLVGEKRSATLLATPTASASARIVVIALDGSKWQVRGLAALWAIASMAETAILVGETGWE